MKFVVNLLLIAVLSFGFAAAQEANCPSSAAANEGHSAFEAFHKVIAPTWHSAWPQKDYEAMFAAGPKFDSAFAPINKMPVVFKTEVRARRFEENRMNFRKLVKEYSSACAARDSAKVYQVLPELHDAFEATASSLLPVNYPEFDGFVVTLDLLKDKHIPEGNMDGILGSSETLIEKMGELNEHTIPPDLLEKKDAIEGQFTEMKKIVDEIKACREKKDVGDLKVQVNLLGKMTDQFKVRFL